MKFGGHVNSPPPPHPVPPPPPFPEPNQTPAHQTHKNAYTILGVTVGV